ncbi:GxxExxY protein [Chryseobacterium elymi]|nr:hypothetical protein [Chryseobacterium elymi]
MKQDILFIKSKHNLLVGKQKPMPLVYDEVKLNVGYRLDFLIEVNLF